MGDGLWSPAVDRNVGAAGIFVPSEPTVADSGVLAEGELNVPQWVSATVGPKRLNELRTSGEMRNFADWANQPGASCLADKVQVVPLR